MNKKLIVKQDGYKECGAACLLSIIRYYNGNVSINKLLELTHTDKNGTSFYNLKMAASSIGLEALGFKLGIDDLLHNIKLPSICQFIDNNYEHFVVLYKISRGRVTVMDPARGFKTMSVKEFSSKWTGYSMSFSRMYNLPYIEDKKYLNKIIIDLLLKNKCIVLNIIFLSIVFTFISCIYAMYSGIVIDNVIKTDKNNLLIITLIFSMFLMIKCFTGFCRNELLIFLNQKLDCSIFLKSFQKVLLLPYSYYKNRTTGEIVSRVNDLATVKELISKVILTVFLDLIISIGCGLILLLINKIMFLLLLITIMIYIIIFYLFKGPLKKYTDINQENNALINSKMIELINGFETIKNLNLESKMNDSMESLYVKSLNDCFVYDNVNNLELFIKDMVTYVSILLVEFIGFNMVFNDVLTIGEIVMFSSLITYFISPIRNIIDLNKEYFYAVNSLKRANNLFDVKSTDLDSKTNYNIFGNIRICQLSYSYNDYHLVLKNISMEINAGEKCLILGDSGSGKSTILKILSKYYSPKRGHVYIDDIDINDISISNIKDNIVSISQEEVLFNDTIKNNILMSRIVDDNDFAKICRMLYIDDIVKDMFLGYDTKLEENGLNISGGQRQRIILARALIKEARIILIDEGLNAIDINLERKILKNIFEEYKDKTIIIVSHRLENMDLFDKVIKFNNGNVDDVITYSKGCYRC